MKPSPEPLSWTPMKRGSILCSPACGYNCTQTAHDKAHRDAAALVASLGGAPHWKPRVWENLGWHHCAISSCGRLKVHPHGYGLVYFTAYLDNDGGGGGIWTAQAKTAKAAARNVVAKATEEWRMIDATIKAVRDLV